MKTKVLHKILLVVGREYATRVKKPSFWILTILVPLFVAVLYALPVYLATRPSQQARVLVADDTQLFSRSFESNEAVRYISVANLDVAKTLLAQNDSIDAIVYIPARETTIPGDAFLYYRADAPGVRLESDVDRQLQEILRNNILLDVHHIGAEDYALITGTRINLHTKDIETGRDGFLAVKTTLGLALALLILVAIFAFGNLVMRGVMEEKGNRIVEIMIGSVRPFQLMMGKVVGICAVGVTQMLLWTLLSGLALGIIQRSHADLFQQAVESQHVTQIATKGTDATAQWAAAQSAPPVSEWMQGLTSINFGLITGMFFFYFFFGYLLYATLFAAVGAVADPESDGNQFLLPLTLPLLVTFLLSVKIFDAPSGVLATWFSIIPFTSPVAMLMRIPFGVPVGQFVASAALLIVSFPIFTWFAAKIYRAGILHYGSKITYSKLFRWLKTDENE
ncbi:MAG: ABC transporter permease [Bacteroidales bacterium]|nr:ABC transporter permease [Bacteroidales bacterium]